MKPVPPFGTDLPASWQALDLTTLMGKRVVLHLSVYRLLVIHTNMVLASKHPDNTGPARAALEDTLVGIEAMLESAGLPVPPDGWRGLPWPPGRPIDA